jgi:hypothetical protein
MPNPLSYLRTFSTSQYSDSDYHCLNIGTYTWKPSGYNLYLDVTSSGLPAQRWLRMERIIMEAIREVMREVTRGVQCEIEKREKEKIGRISTGLRGVEGWGVGSRRGERGKAS